MEKITKYCKSELDNASFDSIAVGVIDFSTYKYESFSIFERVITKSNAYFDLASITKPLTLASTYLKQPEIFDFKMKLLLNHKASLPTHGRLGKSNWKKQIKDYLITEANTSYSDYGALRLMLELEEKRGKDLGEICDDFFDDELLFWQDLDLTCHVVVTGQRAGSPIRGVVHDDNAYTIGAKCSHAGIFSTVDGLIRTIINLDKKYSLLKTIEESYKLKAFERFINGWDRVEDTNKTLAGNKSSLHTFGHLGFTGTSLWIDLEKKRGSVILTNGTQSYWYDKTHLNKMRRDIGNLVWEY